MSARARDEVVVHVDAMGWNPAGIAGSLRRSGFGRSADLSFEYARDWLADERPSLEPSINLITGEQRRAGGGLFGVFTDAAPDHWGRRLLERRELHLAKTQGRRPRNLDDWDFLLGVNDATRMGGLRFAGSPGGPFLDDQPLSVPPKASVRELEAAARRLESGAAASADELDRWLELLIAPGASLGGARPKGSFQDGDGVLWMAKFPALNDRRDVGAWEYVLTQMAAGAGVVVPEIELLSFGPGYRTFAARRFDREAGRRRMFASAMTLLDEHDRATGVSYLDIAAAIEQHGGHTRESIESDLRQLYRRVVFNILVGHRDDHLRNHGFIHDGSGWRLAPAFDLNPIPDKAEHELSFDGRSSLPDLGTVHATARLYRLSDEEADDLISDITGVVSAWREHAAVAGIPREECDLMAPAFEQT